MGGTITYDPKPTPLDGDAIPILVYRFDPAAEEGRFTRLANVNCRRISFKEGPYPSTAEFEYLFDDRATSQFPHQFEDVWPLTAEGPAVVKTDDRLVVYGITAAGVRRLIFDGFAQVPQVDVSPDSQAVTFTAYGTPIRAWDIPIGGAYYRHADLATDSDEDHIVATDWPTRFNPDQLPNCTPPANDTGGSTVAYPSFLEGRLVRDPDPRSFWTVGKAVRYLLTHWNTYDDPDVSIVSPSFTGLDALLQARRPKAGQFYDPNDPATYVASDVVLRDYDATGKAWPDVVSELCGFAGAQFRFRLTQDADDEPVWSVVFFRKDASDAMAPKDLLFQSTGEILDLSRTNVSNLGVSRDSGGVANSFTIETDPVQFEVSIVLGLGYSPSSGDATDRKKFLLSTLASGTSNDRKKYREYVADEAGDGHWDLDTSSWLVGAALDLSGIVGQGQAPGATYVRRLRPADGRKLFSKDSTGVNFKATLCLSRDYAGPSPAVWDGTGHWQPIPGSWELLKDRFGIRVTAEDPEAWSTGKYTGSNPQNPGESIRGITSQADPSGSEQATKRFFLMLTAVIDSDAMILAKASKRDASPTRFVRERRLDAKDHFVQQVITSKSWYNLTANPKIAKDDTPKAAAQAEAERAAQEFPPLVGTCTIPWLTNSYRVGDRIAQVGGRNASLQTNAGTNAGESPQYPFITGIDYEFGDERQMTVLRYSDRREGPQNA